MTLQQHLYPLQGKVQNYSWGGFDFIPRLLAKENKDHKPYAEYWLGAHPNFPGNIRINGGEIALNQFIKQYPAEVLGENVARRFGALPFLLKVLDVRQMLSIQVHPSKASAGEGYTRENAAGIPLTAYNRNYKDDNHKPELMVALSDFWLLHGFKPDGLLRETLSSIPEFSFLLEDYERGGYKELYEEVMLMDQQRVNNILGPILDRILPLYKNEELLKSQEDFWAARAVETFCKDGLYDRGIFSIYFFNLVHLQKGEGIYQPAQMPHAYLEGRNVEVMANSDNVLRAGLTDKYIDVPELLKHVRFEETIPDVLSASKVEANENRFAPPVPEFELYHYQLKGEAVSIVNHSAEILFVMNGSIRLESGAEELNLSKGEAAFIVAETDYSIHASGAVEIFRAGVPEPDKES